MGCKRQNGNISKADLINQAIKIKYRKEKLRTRHNLQNAGCTGIREAEELELGLGLCKTSAK